MGTGYTRNDTGNNIADGNVIDAADLDGEFDAVQAAFNASTGHSHDGTTGEGPQIDTAGLQDAAVTRAKIEDDAVDSTKLDETDSAYVVAGLDTTGTITVDTIGEHTAANGVVIDGVTLKDGGATVTADVNFGDNDKAIFGAGSDLQIYHAGWASFIQDTGTGNLYIDATNLELRSAAGEEYLTATQDGAVTLFYNDAAKLATTSTGIDVTGTVTADGLTVGSPVFSTGVIKAKQDADTTRNRGILLEANADDSVLAIGYNNGKFSLSPTYTSSGSFEPLSVFTSNLERLNVGTNGDISFYEDTGTTPKMVWKASDERLGIGTSSPSDRLHVYNGSSGISSFASNTDLLIEDDGNVAIQFASPNTKVQQLLFSDPESNVAGVVEYDHASDAMSFDTNATERMRIDSSGNVGIGTSSPSAPLTVNHSTSAGIRCESGGTLMGGFQANTTEGILYAYSSNPIRFAQGNGGSERMRIDSSGNVGIGTSSPTEKLEVLGNIALDNNGEINNSEGEAIVFHNLTDSLQFKTSATERMRIDSSGNVGIGTSTITPPSGGTTTFLALGDADTGIGGTGGNIVTFATSGIERGRISGATTMLGTTNTTHFTTTTDEGWSYTNGSYSAISRDSGVVQILNRTGTEGNIVQFRRDGATVGSIGSDSVVGHLFIQGLTTHSGFRFASGGLHPLRNSASIDNTLDMGSSTYRWDDIYATNGTIQTSDRNEKQDIEALSEAEQRVAVACKGLLRKYRWRDSVAEKGDDARIHFGIIAQDLQDAFAAEGLDAGRYAMFISSTWWETQTEVPAVEAVDAVLDDEGNVVTEAVEAKEAYTRTDTYDTAEEAPEGATERTRLGVRYPELLAFIIAAI